MKKHSSVFVARLIRTALTLAMIMIAVFASAQYTQSVPQPKILTDYSRLQLTVFDGSSTSGAGEYVENSIMSGNQYGLRFFVNYQPRLTIFSSRMETSVPLLFNTGSLTNSMQMGVLGGRGYLTFDGPGFDFMRGGENLISITPDGKLAIGAFTPAAQLDVKGSIRARFRTLSDYMEMSKWTTDLDGATNAAIVTSSAAISSDGSTLYFGANDGKLHALKTSTGEEIWAFTTGAKIEPSPAIGADGTIYFGSDDKSLYAVSKEGVKVWSIDLGGAFTSSPAIGEDGTIYIGTKESKSLYAINHDGTEKWHFITGDVVLTSPAIGNDGVIYTGSFDGYLYAINADGTERFKIASKNDHTEVGTNVFDDPRSRVWSSPALKDGILYYAAYDNYVYAVTVSSQSLANSPWPMKGKNVKRTGR